MSVFEESGRLLDVRTIYAEDAAAASATGQDVLSRFPDATVIPVESHWQIPELSGDIENVGRWNTIKKTVLVLGEKKRFDYCRPNGRSTDFIAPSSANGCAMACNYCYVARRKGFANPITIFTNVGDKMIPYLGRHVAKRGRKLEPNQCHPTLWTYDLGENNDCSVDDLVSSNVYDLIQFFARNPYAMGSFATKFVNRRLLAYDPQGHTRVRFSLMPEKVSKVVDVRCSRISERIAAINDFVDAGYEVHINLSPVILYDGWEDDYAELFLELDDVLSPAAKAQLKAEIIMLTHNAALHEVNMQWHPKGEDFLWQPAMQQRKLSQNGMWNLRYKNNYKRPGVEKVCELLDQWMPYCKVRYAF